MVEFSVSGDLILSAGADGAVVVSNVATGMPVARLEGPKGLIIAAHFDSESRRVVGASWDGTARVQDAASPYRRWDSPQIGAKCNTEESLVPDQRFIALSCRSHGTRMYYFLCHRAQARYLMYGCLIPVERLDVCYSQIHANGLLPPHAPQLIEVVRDTLRAQTAGEKHWIDEMAKGSVTRSMHAGCDVDDPVFPADSNDLHINPATRNWPFHLDTINKGYV